MNRFKSCFIIVILLLLTVACKAPPKKQTVNRVKHNFIILLDLSDRLIVQNNQPQRDKEIIKGLYSIFEQNVKKDLYIKSRDEFRVVMAPQLGARLNRNEFEDKLYVNMENIDKVYRRTQEGERRTTFAANLDTLYRNAVFSRNPKAYDGADIWRYFHEDLEMDYSWDPMAKNYLFILTDGYPIVGKNKMKLLDIKNSYPKLQVVLIEAAPREKDMEWDRVMGVWQSWFYRIGVEDYTMIKRGAITKELEQVKELVADRPNQFARR